MWLDTCHTGSEHAGIAAGHHDLAVGPLLLGVAVGGYHLAASSLCIDAGDPNRYAANDCDPATMDQHHRIAWLR